jgi:4-hydroxybenzoate polyprenyltransferase
VNWIAWGRLLRLSLLPTALADVAAGVCLATSGRPAPLAIAWLCVSSLAIYHGAVVLNDWRDRLRDARERPDRALPSGAVSPRGALAAAVTLLGLGVAVAPLSLRGTSTPAHWALEWSAGVALLAVLYDLVGRGPTLGPSLLALCRGGNLYFAAWIVSARASFPPYETTPPPAGVGWCAVAYGAYVFCVAKVGRYEDGDEALGTGAGPRAWLAAAAVVLAGLPAVAAPTFGVGAYWAATLSLVAAVPLFVRAARGGFRSRAAVESAMGAALRRLLACTAVFAASTGPSAFAYALAAAILAGYPLAFALRRVFPPS